MLGKCLLRQDFQITLEEIRNQSTVVAREKRRTEDIKTSPDIHSSEASWKSITIETLEEPAPMRP